jgi:hypothetical protein
MGKMTFTVLGAVAELERNLIKERVHMGLNRARKQGRALGRPRVEVHPLQVAGLRARGLSWNQIADKLGVGRGTVERAFKSLSQKIPRYVYQSRTHVIGLNRACNADRPFLTTMCLWEAGCSWSCGKLWLIHSFPASSKRAFSSCMADNSS